MITKLEFNKDYVSGLISRLSVSETLSIVNTLNIISLIQPEMINDAFTETPLLSEYVYLKAHESNPMKLAFIQLFMFLKKHSLVPDFVKYNVDTKDNVLIKVIFDFAKIDEIVSRLMVLNDCTESRILYRFDEKGEDSFKAEILLIKACEDCDFKRIAWIVKVFGNEIWVRETINRFKNVLSSKEAEGYVDERSERYFISVGIFVNKCTEKIGGGFVVGYHDEDAIFVSY